VRLLGRGLPLRRARRSVEYRARLEDGAYFVYSVAGPSTRVRVQYIRPEAASSSSLLGNMGPPGRPAILALAAATRRSPGSVRTSRNAVREHAPRVSADAPRRTTSELLTKLSSSPPPPPAHWNTLRDGPGGAHVHGTGVILRSPSDFGRSHADRRRGLALHRPRASTMDKLALLGRAQMLAGKGEGYSSPGEKPRGGQRERQADPAPRLRSSTGASCRESQSDRVGAFGYDVTGIETGELSHGKRSRPRSSSLPAAASHREDGVRSTTTQRLRSRGREQAVEPEGRLCRSEPLVLTSTLRRRHQGEARASGPRRRPLLRGAHVVTTRCTPRPRAERLEAVVAEITGFGPPPSEHLKRVNKQP